MADRSVPASAQEIPVGDFVGLLSFLRSRTPASATHTAGDDGLTQLDALATIFEDLGVTPPGMGADAPADAPAHEPPSPSGIPRPPRLVVRSIEQAVGLRRSRLLGSAMPRRALVDIRIDAMSSQERAAWSSRLTSIYNECGCKEGAAGVFMGAVAFAVKSVIARRRRPRPAPALAGLVSYSVLGSTLGKGFGLAARRRRLGAATSDLSRLVSRPEHADAN